ncbi:hypothetical protein GCM10010528_17370 [Gordonia defluvii]|jgi:hypothetical protein|uniref:Secreted protein n=1 Tax=Gordonia defluvii TaxID=283718 RepID=A0ABP6L9Y3_9ACTN|nr:hypothetical protein [Gordonia sp. UBA5067]
MLASTKTLIARVVGTAATAGVAAVVLLGCGSNDSPTPAAASATSAASATASSSLPSAPTESGVAVVPGPNPAQVAPPASVPADRHIPDVPGTKCGATRGPDGALELVVLQGKVDCGTAKKVAHEYGPMIASGQKQTVDGWTCGPSTAENILAACAKGDDAFVFQLPN